MTSPDDAQNAVDYPKERIRDNFPYGTDVRPVMGVTLHYITKSCYNRMVITGCVDFRPGELYERYGDFISLRDVDGQMIFSKVFSSHERALLAQYKSELIELFFGMRLPCQ